MTPKSKLDSWLHGIIEAGWLAALILAPMFFNVFSSRVFEPDKISLIRTIALIMLLAWLVKIANGGPAWLPAYGRNERTNPEENDTPQPSLLQRLWRIPLLVPVLFLILAYIISTIFSVARFVSWWGSYQRLQGTYSFLSYIIISMLMVAHLRRPEQIRRLLHVIVITSLPIAVYGVLQHEGLDPLPWGGDTQTRIAANAGNAIFLAAYLIMAFFFTLERVYSSFAHLLGYKPDVRADNQDLPTAIAGGIYLFILMVQLLAIFWTQSRGPWLGGLLALYLFVLLLFSALRPKYHRLLTVTWVGLGLFGAIALVLINVTPLGAPLRSMPYVGRLTTLLESDEGTGRVRVLIWQGASKMIQPHEPLIFPDGSHDSVNALRPLVGYGPEAMWIAYNPFYPPELAHVEARNASPDRSHNETWDSLVITGVLGFLAYLSVFISIFYWALRWLGLLVNRRDTILFAGLMTLSSIAWITILYFFDDRNWRFFGVALPVGLITGWAAYVTLAAFLHPNIQSERGGLARQLLLITALATITAHFVEIHFGIAIAATRTYFWLQAAFMVVLGMRWAQPETFAMVQELAPEPSAEEAPPVQESSKGRRSKSRHVAQRSASYRRADTLPILPATVMTDLLIFFTFVFIYTTNSRGLTDPLSILFTAVTTRMEGGEPVFSPMIFFMMVFTWFSAVTIGLVGESLRHRQLPDAGWWLRTIGLHAVIVWGGWLIYGGIQGARLIPGVSGNDLDSQLNMVAGHFAVFTWLVVIWLAFTGVVFAWHWLRDRRIPAVGQPAFAMVAGVVLTIIIFVIISSVNVALVRADIIYKQGQAFDGNRNWLSSIELYRRALSARRTEDHYMLFLGRSLLEQAKLVEPGQGPFPFPENGDLNDVLDLTQEEAQQMKRLDLLRAAEVVLKEAQRVNPLNTDHTANLARLYRTWADLSEGDAAMRQTMLDNSIAQYNMAVQLSPNAAHLWNEKGSAHLAREERDLAEKAYLHSLELDDRYEQTYLLLADFYDRNGRTDEAIALLQEGLTKVLPQRTTQMLSFLGVTLARTGDLTGAIDANLKLLDLQSNNLTAIRNLVLLYRDTGDTQEALQWAERGIALATGSNNVDEVKTMRQLAAQIYQTMGEGDQVIAQYKKLRELDPNDANTLETLYNLYTSAQAWNEAVEVRRALAALQPDNYEHPLAIAQILQQTGQQTEALTFANQALTLAPEEDKPRVQLLIDTLNGGG